MTPWATNAECEAGHGVHVIQDEVWTEMVAKDDAIGLCLTARAARSSTRI